MRDFEVDYALSDDGASIAFGVFGAGPVDVLLASTSFPIDLMWDLPALASFLDELGSMARVIAYDQRGRGASDPLPSVEPEAEFERGARDVLAVLDAVGSERPSLIDLSFGSIDLFFAATHPDRVRSLVVAHLRASFPELRGFTHEQRKRMARSLASTRALRSDNPRVAHDAVLQQWWSRAKRLSGSPEATARSMEFAAESNLEPVLSAVRAPTLVLHRTGNRVWDIESSRAAAALIPNATFVELPGSEHEIFLGDSASALAAIREFLTGTDAPAVGDRVLATILFTDIVSSTEQLSRVGDDAWKRVLDAHDRVVAEAVAAHRGRVVKRLGDGMLATFDGPARAVRCATAIRSAVHEQGVSVRAGVHSGEVELLRSGDVAGIAVHIASRVSAVAGADEILVSRTVVDLTGGSGLRFEPRGEHELKGVPGSWSLYAVGDER